MPPVTLLLLVFVGLIFIKWCLGGSKRQMETKEAIEILIDLGVSMEKGNWHLWKAKNTGGEYRLLMFNEKGNPVDHTEEFFPADADGRSDAAAKFMQKVKPSQS